MNTQIFKQIIDKARDISKTNCELEYDTYGKVSCENDVCRKLFVILSNAVTDIMNENNGNGSIAV